MPAPDPTYQVPGAADSVKVVPDSVTAPMVPESRTDPTRTLSTSEMSVENRLEQRRLRREQRRLARQQAMQTGELDDEGSDGASYRGGRQRAWLAQGGGGYGGGYRGAESSGIDDNSADDLSGSSDFGVRGGSERVPRAGNWRGDSGGSSARGQRIQRLERRLAVIEGLLRQVLANQQRLLNR
jgi:hypothetical protein